jgi:CRP-like cAMP-binding protein
LEAFDGCSANQLRELARGMEEVEVPAGEQIVDEGSWGKHVFVLAEGLAHASVGRRRLGTIHAGEFFGELALLDGEPRSATVTAAEPSRVLILDSRRFSALVQTTPSVANRILRNFATRLRNTDRLLASNR